MLSYSGVCEVLAKLIFKNEVWNRLPPKIFRLLSLLVLFFESSSKNIHYFIINAYISRVDILDSSKLVFLVAINLYNLALTRSN